MGPNLAPKRQRRLSVRLGEIGGEPPPATLPYDSYPRRPKSWRFHRDPTSLAASKSSKIRPLTNLVNGGGDYLENPESEYTKFGSRKSKLRKPLKRENELGGRRVQDVAELDFWNRSRLARARVSESNSRGDRNNGVDDGVRD